MADSPLDRDCLQCVLALLPFRDKVRCERVSRLWQEVASGLVRSQRALGNAPTRLDLVDHCSSARHWVTELDTLPKQILTNLSILPKILQKCPELRAIAITRSKEPTFAEAANARRRVETTDRGDDDVQGMVVDEPGVQAPIAGEVLPDGQHDMAMVPGQDFVAMGHGHHVIAGHGQHGHAARHAFMRAHMQRVFAFGHGGLGGFGGNVHEQLRQRLQAHAAPAPRPTSEEDFLDIVAKYAEKLECIDVSGLKMFRGFRAGADEAGAWRLITERRAETLQHVKTFYMRDEELRTLLTRCNRITELSIIYGLRGEHLMLVCPAFVRMSIGSVREFGLQQLLSAPDLRNFRDLSLSNANHSMIVEIAYMRQLTRLNLSLSSTNVTANDLGRVAYLSNLKHLYMKRRTSAGPFEDFDVPFREIILRCPHLETIRLTNMIVEDTSVMQVTGAVRLKELTILLTAPMPATAKKLTDRSLCRIATMGTLKKFRIDYPNTFTENTLIDFLFKAFCMRELVLHGCRELIPIKEIMQAAIRQALSPQRRHQRLTVDVDTPEKILLESVRTLTKHVPHNLVYTISTGDDFYSTRYQHERPSKDPLADEDFDEHEAFLYELQNV